LLPIDKELARRIVEGCHEADIDHYARERKIPHLRDDAARKLLDGVVSYGELVAISAW
jgi:type II secretory ATPase GspE/PulE/Tfp pilus assembly ATPase PilB-like protein